MAEDERGPPRRVYGRRRGRKLRRGLRGLLDDALPRLAIELAPGQPIDPKALYSPPKDRIWLEIGCGGGEHLAWQAERHPDIGMIGCEIYINGVASLVRHIVERKLDNIRVFPEDARELLAGLPQASVERLFLLHPDPWPKNRHVARRFVSPANLDSLARVLCDRGELRIASDHPIYQVWALEQMGRRTDFEWLARAPKDWRERPDDWPATRYEEKAIGEGRQCLYLRYRRVPRRV